MADVRDLAMIDADPEDFDVRSLFRLAAWGTGAGAALFLAILAGISGPGPKRAMTAVNALTGQAQRSVVATAKTQPDMRVIAAERETRLLSEKVQDLTADRDHLVQRLSALEHALDDVTGSIKRTEAAVAARTATARPPQPNTAVEQPLPPPASANAAASAPANAWPAPAASAGRPNSPWPEPAQSGQPPSPQPVAEAEPPPAQEPAAMRPSMAAPLPLPRPAMAAATPPEAAAPPAKPQQAQTVASRPVPPEPPPARQAYAVDLGGEISIGRLQMLWNAVRSSEATVLRGLRPLASVRRAANGGRPEIRLVAGPIRTEEEAARVCAAILDSGRYCEPARFDGQRLR